MRNDEQPGAPRRSRFNFSYNSVSQPEPTTPRPRLTKAERIEKERLRPEKDGPLIFNVASLLRDPEGSHRDYDYYQEQLVISNDPEDKPHEATEVEGFIKLTKIRKEILAQGDGEADVVLECVRCLREFDYHTEYEIEEIFRPSIDIITGLPAKFENTEEAADLRLDGNHLLNLGEAIRQQILVSVPISPVCGDDCPGYSEILERVNSKSTIADSEDSEEEDTPLADPRWAALTQLLENNPQTTKPSDKKSGKKK